MKHTGTSKGILAWMAKNHVAANLLMMAIVAVGVFSMVNIKQEVMPEYDLDIIDISISYPGASPEEIEKGIIQALEEEIRGLEGIKKMTATATESKASIVIDLETGVNSSKTLQDVKSAVDRVSSLPKDAERPLIRLRKRRRAVMSLVIYGDLEERNLFYFSQKIRNELLDLSAVSEVELRGGRQPEISIEVPQATLRSLGLTLSDIAGIVRSSALDVPAGGVKARSGEVLIRTTERRDFASEFGDLAIISKKEGTKVRLRNIAEIQDGFADSEREAYFNGKRAILLIIYRTGDQTPLSISKAVKKYSNTLRPSLPEGVKLTIYEDRSDRYKDRRDLLLKNGLMGLALVLVTLALFLYARLAFWVALGIPISILGSFALLPFLDGTINMVSMFAFLITLGIVVDDAIVVGENIYHKRQKGLPWLEASIEGVQEMAAPMFVAVATNIIAFLPLLFAPGSTGKFFSILPVVVISVFTVSLIECLFILPAHLAHTPEKGDGTLLEKREMFCDRLMTKFVQGPFSWLLKRVLENRYPVAVAFFVGLALAYVYYDSGRINFSFRPRILADRVDAEIILPYGSPIEEVRRIARHLEESGMRAVQKTDGASMVVGVMTDIGDGGSNRAEISFNLVPQDQRKATAREFATLWRKETGIIPGLESLFFDFLIGPGGSASIDVELSHPDPEVLELAARDLAGHLGSYAGVTDIDDGFAQGKPQFNFKIKAESRSLGLKAEDIGLQIRHAFYGAEALRQQRDRNEVKVMVRLPEAERKSLSNIEEFLVRLPGKGEIPLSHAVTIERGTAYTEIKRVDGKRVLNVTASVLPEIANENKILTDLKKEFMSKLVASHSGLRYSFEGRDRDRRESLSSLAFGFVLTLLGILALLAILFGSYTQPLIVMVSIPLAMVNALLGHIIMGYDLSIISVFGLIALCGVVVNGGLILTDTANRFRAEGLSPFDASLQAGLRRFRPIFLAAVTTFFGLAPMIFETSVGARFLIPMAISLGFGIILSTPLILLLTPALYMIYCDVADGKKKVEKGEEPGRKGTGEEEKVSAVLSEAIDSREIEGEESQREKSDSAALSEPEGSQG